MELIRISDRKLKIMLTPTDMCLFDLDEESFCSDSAKTHRSFRLLLEEIHRQTGFSTDEAQISVQYFPSRGGGCEMFLSKLTDETCLPIPKSALPPASQKKETSFHKDCAFRFRNMENLLSACHRLKNVGYIGFSSIFQDEKNNYHLCLSTLSPSPVSLPKQLDFLWEYGNIENGNDLKIYLAEHGKLLCERNAVEVFSRFF